MSKKNQLSRREFIKGLSIFAASMPWLSLLAKEDIPEGRRPSDVVRLGVIGVGSRGSLLMLHLQSISNVEIAAICDDYMPHLNDGKRITENRAKAFVDYRKMLEMKNLDGIIIATPLHLHAKMTIDAMRAGHNVFCEKNMARYMHECKDIVNVQKDTGKILQIGFQRIFDLRYIKAVELIRKGRIGKVNMIRAYWHRNNDWRRHVPKPELEKKINWRLYREFSGGLMTELGAHQVQVANWILDSHPEAVGGFGSINYWKDGREVNDSVSLVYNYPNGIQVIYDSMISNKRYGLEEQILGDKGTMELEAGKIYEEEPPPAPGILHLINDLEHQFFDTIPIGGASWVPDTPVRYKGEYILDQYPFPDATLLELDAFVKSIRANEHIDRMIEHAFYASVTALLGNLAIQRQSIVNWPRGYSL